MRLLARSGEGQVVLLRAEEAAGNPAVESALRVLPEELRVGGLDGHRRLSVLHAGREGLVHLRNGLLVRVYASARKAELGLVLGLGDRGDVVLLLERALALLGTAVADERRPCKARAGVLEEVRASLEALVLALALPVPEAVEDGPRAFIETGAEPVRASVALVASDAVVEEFVADCGRGAPDVLGDCRHVAAAADEELYSVPYVYEHVFHGCFPLCVCGGILGTRLDHAAAAWNRIHDFLDIPKVNARSLPGEGVRDLPSPSTIANLYGG